MANKIELKEAWSLFSAGSYRAARAEARRVLGAPDAPATAKTEAADLLGRTQLEPGAVYAYVLCLALFAVIVFLALHH